MKSIELNKLIRRGVKTLDPSKYPDTRFNLCSISAFDQGEPELLLGKEIGSSKKVLIKGDVVISRIVPHIKRVWEVQILNKNTVLGSGEWIVFNSSAIVGGYLRHFLHSEVFHNQFMSTVKGVGGSLLRADPNQVGKIQIPLPPLATQRKIAAILDAADAYRQKSKALIEKYDQLAQSLFLEMFGDPVKNNKGWVIKKLKDVCLSITDGTHFSPEPQNEGYPYVTAKHVKESGLEFYSKPTYVSEEAHNEIFKRCKPEFGDVLYIKDGATTGIACINTFNQPISLLSSLALLKTDKKTLNNLFLCNWLNNKGVKEKLLNEYMAGAAIKRFTLDKINSFMISVPPITLQNQFAERIQLIEAQKQKARAALAKADELFNSLLQRAFKGELVE